MINFDYPTYPIAMENFDLKKFHALREKTEAEYQKIGKLYCPALKAEVIFNADGLHHLRYTNNRSERNKVVQRNKLKFFNKAVEIIKKSTTAQEYRSGICPFGNSLIPEE